MDAMDDLPSLTISAALDLLGYQKTTPQDLARACFDQINRLNPTLNAYITVIDPQEALEAQQPPVNTAPLYRALRGIPIAVKDLIDVAWSPHDHRLEILRGSRCR
jgi:amidase